MAYAVPNLQDGHHQHGLQIVKHLINTFSLWIGLICEPLGYFGHDKVRLPRLGHKRHLAYILLSGGSHLSYFEDTQAALWRSPHGEELRLSSNSYQAMASHISEPPWNKILQLSQDYRWKDLTGTDDPFPWPSLYCNLMKLFEPDTQINPSCKSWVTGSLSE